MKAFLVALLAAALSDLAVDWFPPYAHEVCLGAAIATAHLSPLVVREPENTWHNRTAFSLLLIGAYLLAYQLPDELGQLGSYRATPWLLLVVYLVVVWIVFRKAMR